jgi:hypothetical protein
MILDLFTASVEQNASIYRSNGNLSTLAYEWLRFHEGNRLLAGQELPTYLVEALAIIPYFSGARAVVLWGYEPDATTQPYHQLPEFMASVARVSQNSDKIGRAKLVQFVPAAVLWQQKKPLIRVLSISDDECIVMGINPWQAESDTSVTMVNCGGYTVAIPMRGRHTDMHRVYSGNVTRL